MKALVMCVVIISAMSIMSIRDCLNATSHYKKYTLSTGKVVYCTKHYLYGRGSAYNIEGCEGGAVYVGQLYFAVEPDDRNFQK